MILFQISANNMQHACLVEMNVQLLCELVILPVHGVDDQQHNTHRAVCEVLSIADKTISVEVSSRSFLVIRDLDI